MAKNFLFLGVNVGQAVDPHERYGWWWIKSNLPLWEGSGLSLMDGTACLRETSGEPVGDLIFVWSLIRDKLNSSSRSPLPPSLFAFLLGVSDTPGIIYTPTASGVTNATPPPLKLKGGGVNKM